MSRASPGKEKSTHCWNSECLEKSFVPKNKENLSIYIIVHFLKNVKHRTI